MPPAMQLEARRRAFARYSRSATRVRMRSSVVIAGYPARTCARLSQPAYCRVITTPLVTSLATPRCYVRHRSIDIISRLLREPLQRSCDPARAPGAGPATVPATAHRVHRVLEPRDLQDRAGGSHSRPSEFDSGLGNFGEFHREESVRKMHRDQRGQQHDRHRNADPGNQCAHHDSRAADQFGERRRPGRQ